MKKIIPYTGDETAYYDDGQSGADKINENFDEVVKKLNDVETVIPQNTSETNPLINQNMLEEAMGTVLATNWAFKSAVLGGYLGDEPTFNADLASMQGLAEFLSGV